MPSLMLHADWAMSRIPVQQVSMCAALEGVLSGWPSPDCHSTLFCSGCDAAGPEAGYKDSGSLHMTEAADAYLVVGLCEVCVS